MRESVTGEANEIDHEQSIGEESLDKHAAFEIAFRKGWLSQTPASFQRAVLDRCLLERFETGTPIYSIGDEPGGMYGIVSGSLAISVTSGDGALHCPFCDAGFLVWRSGRLYAPASKGWRNRHSGQRTLAFASAGY
jgi:hypothetical protein